MKKTYFIPIGKDAHWATQDDRIAAKTAKEVAQEHGGCEMTVLNEAGGGHVTVYDAHGDITGYRPLERNTL